MTTQEAVETRPVTARSRRPGLLVAVVAIIVLVGAAAVAWYVANRPVAADEAQIEMTYTDDGTTYVGDHKIIEGTATLTFSNETSAPVIMAVFGYETGSTALATELAVGEEGESFIPRGGLPAAGFFDVDIDRAGDFEPGSHTLTIDLRPGTYIFDAGPSDFMTAGLWRVAVIEVVAG